VYKQYKEKEFYKYLKYNEVPPFPVYSNWEEMIYDEEAIG